MRTKMKCFLHYGDATHVPMQTVRFDGTRDELRALKREAREEGWPLRVVPL